MARGNNRADLSRRPSAANAAAIHRRCVHLFPSPLLRPFPPPPAPPPHPPFAVTREPTITLFIGARTAGAIRVALDIGTRAASLPHLRRSGSNTVDAEIVSVPALN